MRALTIRQPWAGAIAHADKRIENRGWTTSYRGPVLIHAGKAPDSRAGRHVAAVVRGQRLALGAVVAVARLTDCHDGAYEDTPCSPWAEVTAQHFVLDDVVALPLPVPWRGALQLWKPPQELLKQVRMHLSEAQWAEVTR